MKNIFSDKNIIVTGGASGIGEALVTRFVAMGANVVVVGRSNEYKGPARYFQADMSSIEESKRVFATIIDEMGSIDYIINSAGIFMGGEIRDTPIEKWHEVIDNNIYAIAHGSYLALEHMLQRKSGHIVNIASTAGIIPVPAMGIYGASKYALVGLSHDMRNEVASLGVKVSVVCPTVVNTPLYDTAIYNKVDKNSVIKSRDNLQTAETAADAILKGIVKNRATIHTSRITQAIWGVYRISPRLYDFFARRIMRKYRVEYRVDTHS